MLFLSNEQIFIILVLLITVKCTTTVNPQHMEIMKEVTKKNEELCQEFGKNSYFEPEMVIGKPWRIYYSWNMKRENKCIDMKFKRATPKMIRRIYNDMHEYLEEQPPWDAATLLLTIGRAKHEMLLFADQGPAGRFLAVPNVAREANITPLMRPVALVKFHMKLTHGGKYLVQVDCGIGGATMAARFEEPPNRANVADAAGDLSLGEGSHCLQDNNKDENF